MDRDAPPSVAEKERPGLSNIVFTKFFFEAVKTDGDDEIAPQLRLPHYRIRRIVSKAKLLGNQKRNLLIVGIPQKGGKNVLRARNGLAEPGRLTLILRLVWNSADRYPGILVSVGQQNPELVIVRICLLIAGRRRMPGMKS